eukprot:682667-Ditylum_brightwellii.AAC.1
MIQSDETTCTLLVIRWGWYLHNDRIVKSFRLSALSCGLEQQLLIDALVRKLLMPHVQTSQYFISSICVELTEGIHTILQGLAFQTYQIIKVVEQIFFGIAVFSLLTAFIVWNLSVDSLKQKQSCGELNGYRVLKWEFMKQ